jgi:hypothetical protein
MARGKTARKQRRKAKQKQKARLREQLSGWKIQINDGYWRCLKQGIKRPIGSCKFCKTKRCKYKEAMCFFWTDWVKNYVPDDFRPIMAKVVQDTYIKYRKRKKAWFRIVKYKDGTLEEIEATKLKHLDPDDYEGVIKGDEQPTSDEEFDGDETGEKEIVDTEPFSLFIEVS